jgi:D-3-phosphoglycerate dehydrogenase
MTTVESTPKEFRVLLYEPIHEDAMQLLSTVAEVRHATELTEQALLEQVRDVDGIILRAHGRISAPIMDAAPKLVVAARHGTGPDNIDAEAASERGIYVVNTPGANTQSVAEHCVSMMLALSKGLLQSDKVARQGRWDLRLGLVGRELRGKMLGLVGFGRIGQRVATICHQAFGMRILYYDVIDYQEAGHGLNARQTALDDLLREADYVSVHVPLLSETENLIGMHEFALMKKGAFFLNLARGRVVDEAALIDALDRGNIAGAGLDVFAMEPTSSDNRLLAFENVVVTPHVASLTEEALRRMGMMVVRDVMRALQGVPPENWFNRSLMCEKSER